MRIFLIHHHASTQHCPNIVTNDFKTMSYNDTYIRTVMVGTDSKYNLYFWSIERQKLLLTHLSWIVSQCALLYYFTFSNSRWFYSSMGRALAFNGLRDNVSLHILYDLFHLSIFVLYFIVEISITAHWAILWYEHFNYYQCSKKKGCTVQYIVIITSLACKFEKQLKWQILFYMIYSK
jgi:hypothetical protein